MLGVTLGNSDGVFFAGELDAWLARSGEPQVQDPERVSFWARVRGEVAGAEELYGNRAQRTIERSLSLFRVRLWPARRRLQGPDCPAPRSRRASTGPSRRRSGAQVIVDSSHYPLRAREMQKLAGTDVYLVYLVRDPQSVVASFNRKDVAQYSKATLTTNTYLWLTSLSRSSSSSHIPASAGCSSGTRTSSPTRRRSSMDRRARRHPSGRAELLRNAHRCPLPGQQGHTLRRDRPRADPAAAGAAIRADQAALQHHVVPDRTTDPGGWPHGGEGSRACDRSLEPPGDPPRIGRPELLALFDPGARQAQREEIGIRAVLASSLRPDGTYVDIGADRGQVLREAVRVAPGARHVAFEPIPCSPKRLGASSRRWSAASRRSARKLKHRVLPFPKARRLERAPKAPGDQR